MKERQNCIVTARALVAAILAWALISACFALLPVPLHAQSQVPLLGTWRFNAAKSTSDPDWIPFRRGTCRIEPWGDGVRVTYDLVRIRGGITHLEWTGAFDGKDYPVEGVEADVTNAYRRIDDHAYEIIQKVNGALVLTELLTVSPDGRTITTVAPTRDAQGRPVTITTVYEKT